ncbi:putative glycosyltransferase, type 1 [Natrialba magadii ATCC 43099]|uniref:Glycosyltransferase, type 1 n=1 Tax=Natrialba magadii (strain ATCC 43099 / DSM 3394 / CCM 3739 / CIP 104546 / IAM 13178 / JCM 8861 / NBRC 102185 / NCIMB 2190 / MS3) TaxID=547559 RepID=D3SYD0_NATMM|nr:glycosyltransferase [Natrialba magadii]ADD06101.1 putative glycosyltransferase, type 1 [Natrialba magadii ATCC 43099]ELY30902.1 group 1 glycosyl transferase [Natrialba magadii ATCC 43099]
MRVAFVSAETVFHRDTETNRRLQTVVELLDEAGHDVHVYCTQFWDGEHATFEREGLTYHGVSVELEATASFLVRLPFVLARARPDIVHVSAQRPGQVIAASLGATLSRAPIVAEWYGMDGIPTDRWHKLAARSVDRSLVPSELVATWVRELGVSEQAVDPIANPIDVERIRDVEPGDRADVIYARRLDDGANLESLLLALAEHRDRDWRATVIGDGPEREAYERLASDLRIEDRVTFAGDLSLGERIAAYRGAHVFAQTAEHCVFPTEMLWALAAGCVGVVEYHANSSAHELVEGWDRGFRTTSEDELSDAIIEAGGLEYQDVDDEFDEYDLAEVRDRYLTTYRALQDSSGLL